MQEQELQEPVAQLMAGPVVMNATIHITRAATGAVETYEITGTAEPEGELPSL